MALFEENERFTKVLSSKEIDLVSYPAGFIWSRWVNNNNHHHHHHNHHNHRNQIDHNHNHSYSFRVNTQQHLMQINKLIKCQIALTLTTQCLKQIREKDTTVVKIVNILNGYSNPSAVPVVGKNGRVGWGGRG